MKLLPLVPYKRRYHKRELGEEQRSLYLSLINGLGQYPPAYIATLTSDERRKILYRQQRASEVINRLKQERLTTIVNNLVSSAGLCGNVLQLLTEPLYDPTFVVDIDVDQRLIIDALIKEQLLPTDFYKL